MEKIDSEPSRQFSDNKISIDQEKADVGPEEKIKNGYEEILKDDKDEEFSDAQTEDIGRLDEIKLKESGENLKIRRRRNKD